MAPHGRLVKKSLHELRNMPVIHQMPAIGEVCILSVRAFNEGLVEGKNRPGVVIAPFLPQVNHWKIMGFTTRSTFNNGKPRKAVIDPEVYGLTRQGYLWSPRLPILPRFDIKRRLGVITPRDAMQIIRYCDLTDDEAECLIRAARAAHL